MTIEEHWTAAKADRRERVKSVALYLAVGSVLAAAGFAYVRDADFSLSSKPYLVLSAWPLIVVRDEGVTFHGKACVDNCQGHIAGYCWARGKHLSGEPGQCATNSRSFNEGCTAYLEHGRQDDDEAGLHGESIEAMCGAE